VKQIRLCLLWLLAASAGHSAMVLVALNTTAVSGSQFSIVFDLIDGDATVNNTVTVTGAQFGGGSLIGSPALTGGTSGDLSTSVILGDTDFFNEYLQDFTAGSVLSFLIDFSGNFAGGTPDSLTFLLIDSGTGLPVPTLDPLGTDVLFAMDLSGSVAPLSFAPDPARTELNLSAPVVSSISAAPEPGSLLFVGLGVTFLARRRVLRQSKETV